MADCKKESREKVTKSERGGLIIKKDSNLKQTYVERLLRLLVRRNKNFI